MIASFGFVSFQLQLHANQEQTSIGDQIGNGDSHSKRI